MTDLETRLFEMSDAAYRDFHAKLIPTVDKERIIGVRTPVLRRFAKKFIKSEAAKEFLVSLPHRWYDENCLHSALIANTKDFDEQMVLIEKFLPYVDNWAVCDTLAPKSFKKHTDKVLEKVSEWIKSDRVYTVRFSIVVLMQFFLDEEFTEEIIELAVTPDETDYYIIMAKAWFMSFALIKQYDAAIVYLTERKLSKNTHNKSIQKALESMRIDGETKKYLKTLKY